MSDGFVTIGTIPIIKGDKGDTGPAGPNTVPTAEVLAPYLKTADAPLTLLPRSEADAKIAAVVASLGMAAQYDIVTDGDSLTYSQQDDGVPWPARLGAWLGLNVYNPAVPGEGPNDIAFRQGGLAPQVSVAGGVIPADGSTVTISSITPNDPGWRGTAVGSTGVGVFEDVILAGVRGRLVHQQNAAGTGAWEFTPTVKLYSAVAVPNNSRVRARTVYRSAMHVMWPGRNYPDATVTLRSIASMVSLLRPTNGVTRYLVMTVLPSGTSNDTASLNSAILAAHPNNSLDIVAHLIQNGLAEAGLAATSGDTSDIEAGLIPRSLRLAANDLHLNKYGKKVVGRKVALWLIAKGWVDSNVFIDAPENAPKAARFSNTSQYATAVSPADLRSASRISVEVEFTPQAAMPALGTLLSMQNGGTDRKFALYALSGGNIRFQAVNPSNTNDQKDSSGGSAFAVGQKVVVRVDQTADHYLRFYKSTDGGQSWTLISEISNGAVNLNTAVTSPLYLGGGGSPAYDVHRVTVRNVDRSAVLFEQNFANGAGAFSLLGGSQLVALWPYA